MLYWTDWYLPSIGGLEVFSARLLPELVRRGHEITAVVGHHQAGLPETCDWDGVTVRRFLFHQVLAAGDPTHVVRLIEQVARLKRWFRPDLIHLNTLGPSALFHLETVRHWPAPVLLTMHSPVPEDAGRLDTLTGRALQAADRVNCNSQAVHADLLAQLPALRTRSSVTYYGLDAPELQPAPRPLDEPVILGYGRLVNDKGFDLAIRAFARVADGFPRARLLLVGDGAARPELEQLAAELRLAERVQFAGAVAPGAVFGFINQASLVVVPSRWAEPFGLVALEAALMARPVVAARVGGLPEVVEHGRTGLVVEPENSVALAEAMHQLLAEPATADRLGAAGRERALERFSWDCCVQAYHQLYELTCPVASP